MSKIIGEEHARKLENYLAELRAKSLETPNASAVAAACGFDRGVLYKNPRCRAMWEEHIREVGGPPVPVHTVSSRKSEEQTRRIRDLEQKNADLAERLLRAEAELTRLRVLESVYEHTATTGRDILW